MCCLSLCVCAVQQAADLFISSDPEQDKQWKSMGRQLSC